MREKIKKFFNFKKDISYFMEFGKVIEKKAPMFALFIKIFFSIIKWAIFSLILIILIIGAIKIIIKINWSFFAHNKKSIECMIKYSNYLYFEEIGNEFIYIKDLSDERLKKVSQIWNLDQDLLLKIKKEDKEKEQEYFKKVNNCVALPPPEIIIKMKESKFLSDDFISKMECEWLYEEPTLTYLKPRINEQLKKRILLGITDSSINELYSKGVCPRPSIFR